MCKLRRSLFYCLPLCFFWSTTTQAQVSDDFSDGEIISNPAWSGNLSHFTVNSQYRLQLNAPSAGSSALVLPLEVPDSAVWKLDVQLGFAPSAANRLRLYLFADAPNLSAANGYFLEIGENGSADALKLYRQDAGTPQLIASGTPGLFAADTLSFSLRTRRSGLGEWTIGLEPTGGPTFPSEITANDPTYPAASNLFFGIACTYTSTRTNKFHFDNLRVEEDLPDVLPPVLQSVDVAGEFQLLLRFDEKTDPVSAGEKTAYLLLPQNEMPSLAELQPDGKSVLLTFDLPFATGNYTIQCIGISDPAGNAAGVQTLDFDHIAFEIAAEYDVLVNEIMADPSPSAGLPEVEWVELYNRSLRYLQLAELSIDDGSVPIALPEAVVQPGAYVVLASPSNAAILAAAGIPALAVAGMPSLNNESDLIRITTQSGSFVDQVRYTSGWHDEQGKQDGGWSLERIDPSSPCLGASNWRSCTLPIGGGTPGTANAALDVATDTQAPFARSAIVAAGNVVKVRFSEGLDRLTVSTTDVYEVSPALALTGAAVTYDAPDLMSLTFAEAFQSGVVYRLVIRPGLRDCAGNVSLIADTLWFGLPEKPESGDVVISELLFNPPSGGSDYVEFYNRSEKVFAWKNFFLDNAADNNGAIALDGERLFLPGDHVVFSADSAFVADHYGNVEPKRLMRRILPSLPDDEGNLTLLWSDGSEHVVVDAFDYSEDYHNALLNGSDRDGVPLERIGLHQETSLASNWTSAARNLAGLPGTPTKPNSQQGSAGAGTSELLFLPVNRLSPDGDGREDFLEIQYNTPGSGYAANMTVFDSWGIPVKQLIRQTLVSTGGILRWDGDDDSGSLVRPGIYVLLMEMFSPEGDVRRAKMTVAVVANF